MSNVSPRDSDDFDPLDRCIRPAVDSETFAPDLTQDDMPVGSEVIVEPEIAVHACHPQEFWEDFMSPLCNCQGKVVRHSGKYTLLQFDNNNLAGGGVVVQCTFFRGALRYADWLLMGSSIESTAKQSFLDKGNRAFVERRFEDALNLYSRSMEEDEAVENDVILANRSAAYLALGFFEKALEDAQASIEINPHAIAGYVRAGNASVACWQFSVARDYFQCAAQQQCCGAGCGSDRRYDDAAQFFLDSLAVTEAYHEQAKVFPVQVSLQRRDCAVLSARNDIAPNSLLFREGALLTVNVSNGCEGCGRLLLCDPQQATMPMEQRLSAVADDVLMPSAIVHCQCGAKFCCLKCLETAMKRYHSAECSAAGGVLAPAVAHLRRQPQHLQLHTHLTDMLLLAIRVLAVALSSDTPASAEWMRNLPVDAGTCHRNPELDSLSSSLYYQVIQPKCVPSLSDPSVLSYEEWCHFVELVAFCSIKYRCTLDINAHSLGISPNVSAAQARALRQYLEGHNAAVAEGYGVFRLASHCRVGRRGNAKVSSISFVDPIVCCTAVVPIARGSSIVLESMQI